MTHITILILGVCGFMVARHIRRHKTKNTPLVCMVGFDCHAVVHSDYSKFFGVPVEVFGMFYYILVSISSMVFIFLPEVLSSTVIGLLALVSFAAFLFSAYLIILQIFVLKKGCSWCIVSALISTLIFILTFFY